MDLKQIISFQGVSFDERLIVSPRWPHHVLKLVASSSLIVKHIVSPNTVVARRRQAWQLPQKAN
jgi:hypothetical protein